MKRLLLFFAIFCITLMSAEAGSFDVDCIKYKPLKVKDKISYDEGSEKWSANVNKKSKDYYIKTISEEGYEEYVTPDKTPAFATGAVYEFLYDGALIGYSNSDLNFYEYEYKDGALSARALSIEEVEQMLPNVHVVAVSEFSKNTNSYKIKKKKHEYDILIFNDADIDFSGYRFSSGNAKYETYPLNGLVKVKKAGMLHFSKEETNSKESPWYVILVR